MVTKTIYHYSLTGKTKAIFDYVDCTGFNVIDLRNISVDTFDFTGDVLIIACPTYGRGAPPNLFKKLLRQLYKLESKKIGLLGSGNTIYGEDFCGALDVLEEILQSKNEIIFKLPFEGYPRAEVIEQLNVEFNKLQNGEFIW